MKEYLEERASENIASATYGVYFKSVFGLLSPIMIIFLVGTCQALTMIGDYLPLYW